MMDMEMTVYTISFDNYHGETYVEHYFQMKTALARFIELQNEGRTKDEFESTPDGFSFFDACYNKYSTYITLTAGNLKDLFMDEIERKENK